ncbi:aspartate aminotransferase family protein [Roseomonas sp. WA12]
MSHILHRNLRKDPMVARSGRGLLLTGADGREIIDASGGAAVACIGHGDERVVAAITQQARELAYAHTVFFTCEAAEELAELLVGDRPGGLSHAYFVSSGSEAMEAALKLARQYFLEIGQPRRQRYIARRQSYHGNTLGALGLGGNMARREPYTPILADCFSHVSPCFPYREQGEAESDAEYVTRLADELDAEFARLGPDTVVAFVAETVVGATTGCVTALPGYFPAMRAVCDRYGALLILDEVMCGMGRTGTLHAWEQEEVAPDIQTIAKGLGGGYQPIGGILVAERVVQALAAGSGAYKHGHTYQAHPVACAAALAVQHIIAADGLLANVNAMGARLEAALQDRFGNHARVGDIRGRGLFWALEFVEDRATRRSFDPALQLNDRVKAAALKEGVAIYPMGGTIDGRVGDHVIISPPYIAAADDIDRIVERLGRAVDAVVF